MKSKQLEKFINLFRGLGNAGIIISGLYSDNEKTSQFLREIIEKCFNDLENLGFAPYKNVLKEIEKNLYTYPEGKETYVIRILRDFKDISPYLDISVKKEYCISHGKPALKIWNVTYFESHVNTHKTIERYCGWTKPRLDYDTGTIPEKYIIQCFTEYEHFFNLLDAMCIDFNLELMDIQRKICLQVWERDKIRLHNMGYVNIQKSKTETSPPQPNKARPKSDLSIPEWATIFYYVDSAKALTEADTRKSKMENFITQHNIDTTIKSFTNNFYDIRKRINESNYPSNKIEKILFYLKKYPIALELAENDILYLKEEAKNIE